jgi:hypothetical protein
MEVKKRFVVCAALMNKVNSLIICGARHFDQVMQDQIREIGGEWGDAEQGFIDQYGTFLTREMAWIIANESNQIIKRVGGDNAKLFSENLY